jgi:hypothetical protein
VPWLIIRAKLAFMSMQQALATRLSGAAGIAALFAVQSAYQAFLCGGGLFGFWQVTLYLSAPAALLLLVSGSPAALVSCLAMLPFILLANAAECAPSRGGGAAMGYVPALLFGLPLSLVAGAVTGWFFRPRARNEG